MYQDTPQPKSLDELFDVMKANDPTLWTAAELPFAHGEMDWTELPTFGGEAPTDTKSVWSWDQDRLIVGECADNLAIVKRSDW